MTGPAQPPTGWWTRAACANTTNAERFSPVDHRGQLDLTAARQVADEYCARCPALADCWADAVCWERGENHIVRAGWWWRDGQPHTDLLADAGEVAA